jgi:predicted phage-related endonuclease
MTKCKQAIENPTPCGKDICCFECEDKLDCKEVCPNTRVLPASDICDDAFSEEHQMTVFKSSVLAITQTIANIATQKKRLEDEDKKMREELEQAMSAYGVNDFENEFVKITHVGATTKTTVDSKKLKAELPDIYQKYSKVSDVKGYVKISVK